MHKTRTIRQNLAARIREVRVDRFGVDEEGVIELANALGIPSQTWINYEDGVTMPAEILLRFIDQTGIDYYWLLTGQGEQYSVPEISPKCRFDH